MSEINHLTVPAVLRVDVAGSIIGLGRVAAYRAAQTGVLPVLPGPGRMKVITARLEAMIGRRLTADDVLAAEKAVLPRREAARKYLSEYREHRAQIAAKKQSAVGGPRHKKVSSDGNAV